MSFKQIAAVAIILLLGGGIAKVLIDTAPKQQKKVDEKCEPIESR